jgi:DNA-binding NarL/FixJ family response regulator
MLSGHGEKSHVEQALQAGARGYILKGHADDLPEAVRRLVRGERYLSSGIDHTP